MVEEGRGLNKYDAVAFANLLATVRERAEELVRAAREARRGGLTTEYAEWRALSASKDALYLAEQASAFLLYLKDRLEEAGDSPAAPFFLELSGTRGLAEALSREGERELVGSIGNLAAKLKSELFGSGLWPPSPSDKQGRGIMFCVDERSGEVDTLAEVSRRAVRGAEELRRIIERSAAFRAAAEVARSIGEQELDDRLLDAEEATKALFNDERVARGLGYAMYNALLHAGGAVEVLDALSGVEPTRLDGEPRGMAKAAKIAVELKRKLKSLSEMAKEGFGIDVDHYIETMPEVDYSPLTGAGKLGWCYAIRVDGAGSAAERLEELGSRALELAEKLSEEFERSYSYAGACVVDRRRGADAGLLAICEGAGEVSIGDGRRFIGNVVGRSLFLVLPKLWRGDKQVGTTTCRISAEGGGRLAMDCEEPYTSAVRGALPRRCTGDRRYVYCKDLSGDDLRKVGAAIAEAAAAVVRGRGE